MESRPQPVEGRSSLSRVTERWSTPLGTLRACKRCAVQTKKGKIRKTEEDFFVFFPEEFELDAVVEKERAAGGQQLQHCQNAPRVAAANKATAA